MKTLYNNIFGRQDGLSLLDSTDELYKIIEPLNKNVEYLYLFINLMLNSNSIRHILTKTIKLHEEDNSKLITIELYKKEIDLNYNVLYMLYENNKLLSIYDENSIDTEKFEKGFQIEHIIDNIKYELNFENNNYEIKTIVFRGIEQLNAEMIDEDQLEVMKMLKKIKNVDIPNLIKQIENNIGKKFDQLDEQNINEQWNTIINKINIMEGNMDFDESKKYTLDILEWILDTIKQLKIQVQNPMYTVDHSNVWDDLSIDWREGNIHKLTLKDNIMIDFTNPEYPMILKLIVDHDDSGTKRDIFFPDYIKWKNGQLPELGVNPNSTDIIEFMFDGMYYYAICENNYISGLNPSWVYDV
jgi:hypothetical protein